MSTSGQDIIVSSLQKIGVLDIVETAIPADMTSICLRELNQLIGQRNLRPGLAKYVRSQQWAFAVARDSYTIGAAGDSPNFAVTAGGPPIEMESAKIINTDGSMPLEMPCAVWTKAQYDAAVSMPTLASSFPIGIYYQASFPLGVIFPWPANPTFTAYKLELNWPDQFLEIALTDLSTAIRMAPGLERDLTLQLALALCIPFQKTPSKELTQQASLASTDFKSRNRKPPNISTAGPFSGGGSGWNWLSHRPG